MEDPDFYQLRDPLPADPFLPGPELPWWLWVLAALAAVTFVTLLLLLIRKPRRQAGIDVSAARRQALAALDAIDPSGGASEVATGISLAFRRLLADILGDPALFETHEEFLAREATLDGLPNDQRRQTRDLFATLARLKYGPDTEADTSSLFTESRNLLQNLQPSQAQNSKSQTPNPNPRQPLTADR